MGSHGTNFPSTKHPRDGIMLNQIGNDCGVVVWAFEQMRSSSVAGEDQCSIGRTEWFNHEAQVLVSRCCITDLELNGAPHRSVVTDGDGTGTLIGTHDTANKEVACTKVGLVFVNHSHDLEALIHQHFLGVV